MDRNELYTSIALRTGGDIYLGVVGPVRTGKSTFIKRFMDTLILPQIEDEYERARLTDELPQSAAGKTVMTTQPRFVPNEAAEISLSGANLAVRLVDCVGYMVDGAGGFTEDDAPRMIRTPWSDDEMTFEQAAELGTRKVITDHSTIGIVMTTDGSITSIPREAYIGAEERVIRELREQGKPFVVVLNSVHPSAQETVALAVALQQKYGVSVQPMDVLNMTAEGICDMLELVLMEFPLRCIRIELPDWVMELGDGHYLMQRVREPVCAVSGEISRMRDYIKLNEALSGIEDYEPPAVRALELGSGEVCFELKPESSMFYRILGEECGFEIKDDADLISSLRSFVEAKRQFDRLEGALESAMRTGYGMVTPSLDDMELEKPSLVRQGSRFGVRLKAKASGMHLIKVDMESEVAPIVGTEQQSEEFRDYLVKTMETDPSEIWQMDIFGKSIRDMVGESMASKARGLPDSVQQRLQSTVERMVNDGCNGLICIML